MSEGFGGDGSLFRHGEPQVFRDAVSLPLVIGSLHDFEMAADAIASGQGGLLVLVRPLIAAAERRKAIRQARQMLRAEK